MRVRLVSLEKVYILPPTQPNPNVAKVRVKLFVTDFNTEIIVDADWSDVAATLKVNLVAATILALKKLYDDVLGEYDYNPSTNTLTKVM